jgi:ribosomal-protein-alanine N-acetyltransferase
VRIRNGEWLTKWEPLSHPHNPDPSRSRDAFANRCASRDRERHAGNAYAMGIFVGNSFAGEINLNNVMRGAMQSATIGYWIDRSRAGNAYMSEAVVVMAKFAFEELRLHRIEICIIPRNTNSLRVVDKIGMRNEGLAERFLEINGVWEDHYRFGLTTEEWSARRDELAAHWL